MKLLLGVLASAVLALAPYVAAAQISPAWYVSPTGSDAADGQTISTPFATLERARTAAERSSTKTVYLLGGTFERTTEFILRAADYGQHWLGYPGQTPIIDGQATINRCFIIEPPDVIVRWITIQNCNQSAIYIVMNTAANITIDSNTIINTFATGGTAAIEIASGCNDCKVTHNLVQHSNWVGIDAFAAKGYNFTNLLIDRNIVQDSCKTVDDCGAIHLDDRNHLTAGASSGSTTGVVVSNNILDGCAVVGKYGCSGVYLDDYTSNTTVTANLIYGTGSRAFKIHGGDSITITGNIIDLSNLAQLFDYEGESPNSFGGMENLNNTISCNIIYSTSQSSQSLWFTYIPGAAPIVKNNLYYNAGGGNIDYSKTYADSNPTVANPGFNNAAGGDYSFAAGAPPAFCNTAVAMVDLNGAGPVANVGQAAP